MHRLEHLTLKALRSEVDILKDGTLDFSDDVLARLDFVVASVHTLFTLDREAQTARIIKAIENEHVDMVGHLTGRLLNKREPYDVDIAKVIDAAAAKRQGMNGSIFT